MERKELKNQPSSENQDYDFHIAKECEDYIRTALKVFEHEDLFLELRVGSFVVKLHVPPRSRRTRRRKKASRQSGFPQHFAFASDQCCKELEKRIRDREKRTKELDNQIKQLLSI